MTTTTKILTPAQAQAVYSAMCTLNQIGAVIDVDIPDGVDRIRSARVLGAFAGRVQVEQLWDDHKRELYSDPAAFAAAYGLDLRANRPMTSNEAHIEAVANANAHLNNACMPTMRDLDQAITAGAPQVVDFSVNGRRQDDFALGWNTAMGRVYDCMRQVILTQRAINNAEQSH